MSINITTSKDYYLPGEPITVDCSWDLKSKPKYINLELKFFTDGRGDNEEKTVCGFSLKDKELLTPQGGYGFEFSIPKDIPLSYRGKLIFLRYELHATTKFKWGTTAKAKTGILISDNEWPRVIDDGTSLNPFRTSCLQSLPWLDDSISLEKAFQIWQDNGFRGQIVAPMGHGKTTLAKLLKAQAEANGHKVRYLFANADSKQHDYQIWYKAYENSLRNEIFICDGIMDLPSYDRKRWLKSNKKMLLLVHEPVDNFTTICSPQTSLSLFEKLVKELCKDEPKQPTTKELEQIFEEHQGNIRSALLELYDRWAEEN